MLLYCCLLLAHRIQPTIFHHIEPSVGFGGFFGRERDHVAEVAFCADLGGEVNHHEKRIADCRRTSTIFQIFFQIFSAVSVGRSRSAEAVKKNRTKKEKFFCKKVLTAADFRAKTPPYPPDESPSKRCANPKLACSLLWVVRWFQPDPSSTNRAVRRTRCWPRPFRPR